MEVGDAIKQLLKAGFTELNQVGSHKKFGREGKRITLVYHRSPKERLNRKTEKELKNLLNGKG